MGESREEGKREEPSTSSEGRRLAQCLRVIAELDSVSESLQGQGLEEKRESRLDSLSVSQSGFCGLQHLCICCLYAIYTEIYRRYFCLTPFVREYNNNIDQLLDFRLEVLDGHSCCKTS